MAWSIAGGVFTLDCTIPPNTSATVHIPTADSASIREGNAIAAYAADIRLIGYAIFEVGSGIHHFTAAAG